MWVFRAALCITKNCKPSESLSVTWWVDKLCHTDMFWNKRECIIDTCTTDTNENNFTKWNILEKKGTVCAGFLWY